MVQHVLKMSAIVGIPTFHFTQRHLLVKTIDIERKNRLLKVCYAPATRATFLAFFLFFLLWPLAVLMKQTRQVVRAN